MSNELTIVNNENKDIWKDEKAISDIKEVFGKDLTMSEFKIFNQIGVATGLNPYLREIWAVKYDKNRAAQIFIGRDGYRKVAQLQADYDGHMTEAVYENDRFSVKNGNVEHEWNLKDRGKLLGGYTIVNKKGIKHPIFHYVEFKEYNQGNKIWVEKPVTMIKKVAEAQALRMAWQGLFAGTYDESEKWRELDEPKHIQHTQNNTNNNSEAAVIMEIETPKSQYEINKEVRHNGHTNPEQSKTEYEKEVISKACVDLAKQRNVNIEDIVKYIYDVVKQKNPKAKSYQFTTMPKEHLINLKEVLLNETKVQEIKDHLINTMPNNTNDKTETTMEEAVNMVQEVFPESEIIEDNEIDNELF